MTDPAASWAVVGGRLHSELVDVTDDLSVLDGAGSWIVTVTFEGRASFGAGLSAQARAENLLIVGRVRNDLGRVAQTGSADVDSLLRVEAQPGLVHLVSTVTAKIPADTGWADQLAATVPPASVAG